MNISSKNRGLLDFYAIFCPDFSAHFSTNNHRAGLDLSLDAGPLANNQGVWGINLAAEYPANAHSPKEAELSLELAAGLDDARNGGMNDPWT